MSQKVEAVEIFADGIRKYRYEANGPAVDLFIASIFTDLALSASEVDGGTEGIKGLVARAHAVVSDANLKPPKEVAKEKTALIKKAIDEHAKDDKTKLNFLLHLVAALSCYLQTQNPDLIDAAVDHAVNATETDAILAELGKWVTGIDPRALVV